MDVIERVRDHLRGMVDDYEIYLVKARTLTIEVKDGRIDSFERAETEGVGLRVLKDKRLGFSFASSLDVDTLRGVAEDAVEAALNASMDPHHGLPERKGVLSGDLRIYDRSLKDRSDEERLEKALALERSARAFDKRVRRIRKASYRESVREVVLVREGWTLSYLSTRVSGGVIAVAEDRGDSQVGWEWENKRGFDEIDPERIGIRAAERAVRLLGARPGMTIRVSAILENSVVAEFLEILSSSFLADNLHKGRSMLRGRLGEEVFSKLVDVIDDGTMPGGWATSPFDDEGVPRGRTVLVEKGVLKGYLYDYYWARKAGRESTGNGSRSSFKTPPSVSSTNLYIPGGEVPFDGLIESIDKGIVITDLLGTHTANPVTGDFSFGAMGLWIEGGRITHPVKGIAIAGNILELFKRVVTVGRDVRFFGGVGAPSLLLEDIEISG